MPTRLLAIDIDGTLLDSERNVHPLNVVAIQKAQTAGIQVVLASGRIAASLRHFSNALSLGGPMICSNGAHVEGFDGQEILHETLDQAAIDIAIEYTTRVGVHVSVYTRDDLFFIGHSKWCDIYSQRVKVMTPKIATWAEIQDLSLLKIILIDEPEEIQKHRRALEQILPRSLAALTESEPDYLEILPPTANKGNGLAALSAVLGIGQSDTAAIGDYLNDLEMVQWAGIGAAMGNAVDELKSAADVVVKSNDEAGVAEFIDLLVERNQTN